MLLNKKLTLELVNLIMLLLFILNRQFDGIDDQRKLNYSITGKVWSVSNTNTESKRSRLG